MSPPAVGYIKNESISFPFSSYVAKTGVAMSAEPIPITAIKSDV
jgi:hypothetical protein